MARDCRTCRLDVPSCRVYGVLSTRVCAGDAQLFSLGHVRQASRRRGWRGSRYRKAADSPTLLRERDLRETCYIRRRNHATGRYETAGLLCGQGWFRRFIFRDCTVPSYSASQALASDVIIPAYRADTRAPSSSAIRVRHCAPSRFRSLASRDSLYGMCMSDVQYTRI